MWIKLTATLTAMIALFTGVYFYSLNSDHPMAYQLRTQLGFQERVWTPSLVEAYVELRLATRRFGQRTPQGQAARQAILELKGYSLDSYTLQVNQLKENYQEWYDFQEAVLEHFEAVKLESKKLTAQQIKNDSSQVKP